MARHIEAEGQPPLVLVGEQLAEFVAQPDQPVAQRAHAGIERLMRLAGGDIGIVAGINRRVDRTHGGFAPGLCAGRARHGAFVAGIAAVIGAQFPEHDRRIARHAQLPAREPGQFPLRVPRPAQLVLQHADAGQGQRHARASRVLRRARRGGFGDLGLVPEQLQPRLRRVGAGEPVDIDEDFRGRVLEQPDGGADGIRAMISPGGRG